ncbi:MAG TPA: nuclease-related domain-containing protein [Pseudogracilibacillus sp.]|nr:nuclease-related domain-containing protein [Pseudogracilibacillus sp.]
MEINHFQEPHTPQLYLVLQALATRKNLSPQDAQKLAQLRRGQLGERAFFEKIKPHLPKDVLIMHSLNLYHQDNAFQIDHLLFFHQKLYLFETKYFAGDYLLHDGIWTALESNQEINSPLNQLNRSSQLLSRLVRSMGWSGKIVGQVTFMHEAFTLYGARPEQAFIFLSQFERKLKRIFANEGAPLPQEYELAQKLAQLHRPTNHYDRRPDYTYDQLWKGVICPACQHRMQRKTERFFYCPSCQTKHRTREVLFFNVKQFFLLFPEYPFTIAHIHDWCGGQISKRSIRNILEPYAVRTPHKRGVTFALPKHLKEFSPFDK